MFDLPLWLVTAGLANEVEVVNQYAGSDVEPNREWDIADGGGKCGPTDHPSDTGPPNHRLSKPVITSAEWRVLSNPAGAEARGRGHQRVVAGRIAAVAYAGCRHAGRGSVWVRVAN